MRLLLSYTNAREKEKGRENGRRRRKEGGGGGGERRRWAHFMKSTQIQNKTSPRILREREKKGQRQRKEEDEKKAGGQRKTCNDEALISALPSLPNRTSKNH